jgi:hypothetical protein
VSGLNPRGLEVLFDRFATVRFLQPDVSMSVLDESALSFVADRIDEHFECVRRLGGEAIESAPLRVRRSLYEARFDTGYSVHDGHLWETDRQYSASALAWLEGIEQWRRRTLSEARERFGSAICATILASAQSAARGRRPIDDSADSQMIHRLRSYLYRGNDRSSALMVGGELLFLEALNVALRNESSPWTPLIALWERGCAPLVGIDGAWVLYVPVYARTRARRPHAKQREARRAEEVIEALESARRAALTMRELVLHRQPHNRPCLCESGRRARRGCDRVRARIVREERAA